MRDAQPEVHVARAGPLATLVTDEMRLTVLPVAAWTGEPVVVDADEHDRLGWSTPADAAGLDMADARYPALLAAALGR